MDDIFDKAAEYRLAIARRKDSPPEMLELLSHDPWWFVRDSVASNPNTSADVLKFLLDDLDFRVRTEAKNNLSNRNLLEKNGESMKLYHATFMAYMDGIKEKGLLPGENKNWADCVSGVVYLADDPEVAISYCEVAEDVLDDVSKSGICCFEVDMANLDSSLLFEDPNILVDEGDVPSGCYAYAGVIPFENLRVYQQAEYELESASTTLQVFNLNNYKIDLSSVENRRFMYHPDGWLVLGAEDTVNRRGQGLLKSHAEEHFEAKRECDSLPAFDEFVRGWIGFGGAYKNGIIHFAPNIPSKDIELFDKAFSFVETVLENGFTKDAVLRGFPGDWEQPIRAVLPDRKPTLADALSVASMQVSSKQCSEQKMQTFER